jgi:thiol-disulfide isomerase/thioredoxin
MRRLLPLVAALLAAVALAAGCGAAGLGENDERTLVSPGDRTPAPAVSLAALDGGPRVTLASHRGRPVVMNMWASWCEPCQRETPALIAFSKEHPGLDVIGVATNDAPSDSRRFARQKGIPYAIGVDQAGSVAARYGATGLPTTVVIDAEGRVADTFYGEISPSQLEGYAEQLGV